MHVFGKIAAIGLLVLVNLASIFFMALSISGTWPYGPSGYALNDAINLYMMAHLALIIAAAIYLTWRRFAWSSITIVAGASLIVVAGYFALNYLVGENIKTSPL